MLHLLELWNRSNAILYALFVCNRLLSAATGLQLGTQSITYRCEQTAHRN